jgi:PPP family 3-phenylpropionic acid transporter
LTDQTTSRISPYLSFSFFFFVVYGSWGTINSYLPVYFNSFSFTNTEIGVLSAVGPFGALFGMIFWGVRADRSKLRNNVLLLLCGLLGALSQLYLLAETFAVIFLISVV